jgi:hypothetical protein
MNYGNTNAIVETQTPFHYTYLLGKDENMAIDPRKRQKQLARKAAKRKAVQSAKKDLHGTGGVGSSAKQLVVAEASPIHECLMPEGIFEVGIGNVIVSRKLPNGDIGASFFLVDVHCLGIKFAFFQVMPETEYLRKLGSLGQHETFRRIHPSCARKLVENAEAYAREIGFNPHHDYHLAGRIFGDIDASVCPTDFTFGKDGKPFFVSGPRDTPGKCKQIMDTLLKRFGPDGFHYTIQGEREVLEKVFGSQSKILQLIEE